MSEGVSLTKLGRNFDNPFCIAQYGSGMRYFTLIMELLFQARKHNRNFVKR